MKTTKKTTVKKAVKVKAKQVAVDATALLLNEAVIKGDAVVFENVILACARRACEVHTSVKEALGLKGAMRVMGIEQAFIYSGWDVSCAWRKSVAGGAVALAALAALKGKRTLKVEKEGGLLFNTDKLLWLVSLSDSAGKSVRCFVREHAGKAGGHALTLVGVLA